VNTSGKRIKKKMTLSHNPPARLCCSEWLDLLVVGGWKVSSWTLPHREDGLLSELRRLADDELSDKIDRYDNEV
jgi:hypothetical protein